MHVGVPRTGLALLSDTHQQTVADRLQIIGETWDHEFTQQGGGGRVAEVDGEKRIGLHEGHKVGLIADEPRRVQLFARRQSGQASRYIEGVPDRVQHVHTVVVAGTPDAPDGLGLGGVRGHVKIAALLVHRELVDQRPRDQSTGLPRDIRSVDGEAVDAGVVG